MILKEDPKVSNHELALTKVAAWTWHGHGSGFEQTTVSETSRYKREAMENKQENIRASTYYFSRSMLCTTHVGSSLLDAYEIERISKDLDRYIQSSCDQYHHPKFVHVVRDPSSTKEDKTIKETKWFGFMEIYKLCRSIEGGVVENVQLPALKEGR